MNKDEFNIYIDYNGMNFKWRGGYESFAEAHKAAQGELANRKAMWKRGAKPRAIVQLVMEVLA